MEGPPALKLLAEWMPPVAAAGARIRLARPMRAMCGGGSVSEEVVGRR